MRQTFSRILMGGTFLIACHSAAPALAADSIPPAVVRFDIQNIVVSGNTLLTEAEVNAVLRPFYGKDKDFGDVQRALEALEAVYHKRGFNVVQVELPEQELNKGEIRFKVVQTRIGKIVVDGQSFFTSENIRRSVPGLKEGQTPNIAEVSASMRMANENPVKKISMQIESGSKDEEVDVLLKVADERVWKLGANIANTGTSATGKTHLGLLWQHANLWDLDHVASVQYNTTFEKPGNVHVYGLGYHVPLYSIGDSLDFFASYSNVDSGTVSVGTFDLAVSGKGRVFGMRYNHNLKRIGDFEPKLSYGLDHKAFINSVALKNLQLGSDVTVHPLSIAYSGSKPLQNGDVNFSVTLLRNISGGKNGRGADFNAVRAGANPNFTILRVAAGYNHNFAQDWQMRLSFNGQYTPDALIPGEQFGAGGASSVRGFNEREISNDYGMQINAELYTPNLCKSAKYATQCRMLFFYDGAHALRNNALAQEPTSVTIGSLGLGWRILMGRYVSGQLDWGRVINAGGIAGKSNSKLHFKLNFSY